MNDGSAVAKSIGGETPLERELKELIISTLALEEISPADIGSELVLFGDGLGLDSVDALELAVTLQKKYGVILDPKDESTVTHMTCVRNLARLIESERR